MTVSYRVFVIENDCLIHISKQSFKAFFERGEPELTKFSGQDIVIAMVSYKLENRRPIEIIQIDPMKIRVISDGSMDLDWLQESIRLETEDKWFSDEPNYKPEKSDGNVIYRNPEFDRRKKEIRQIILSSDVLMKIEHEILGAGSKSKAPKTPKLKLVETYIADKSDME